VAGWPLLLKLISRSRTPGRPLNRLTVQVPAPLLGFGENRLMLSALVGTFILLSIAILMAHALDAFRSGSGQ